MKLISKRVAPGIMTALRFGLLVCSVEAITLDLSEFATPPDGMAYLIIRILLSELVDKTFYTALMAGFIYGPSLAFFGYFFACAISSSISALAGKGIDLFPKQILNIIIAALYVVYGLLGFIYIYQERTNPAEEADPEEAPKKPAEHDDERKSLIEKKDDPEKGEKKAGEEEEKEGEENKEKEKTLTETATDLNFMKSGIKRFLITIVLLIVTDMTDRSFRTIWQLRNNNSLATTLLAALIVFLFLAIILLIATWVLTSKILKKLNKGDTSKIVKTTACAVMVFIGLIQLFRTNTNEK